MQKQKYLNNKMIQRLKQLQGTGTCIWHYHHQTKRGKDKTYQRQKAILNHKSVVLKLDIHINLHHHHIRLVFHLLTVVLRFGHCDFTLSHRDMNQVKNIATRMVPALQRDIYM